MPVVLRVKGYRFWFYEADLMNHPTFTLAKKTGKQSSGWNL